MLEKNQPLKGFVFSAWTNKATGYRWFSVERGKPGNLQFPHLSQSYIATEGETMDAFQSAVAVAVMQAAEHQAMQNVGAIVACYLKREPK